MSERDVLAIKCQGAAELDIKEMVPIQGELKKLKTQDKDDFKRRMKELGFDDPINIWKDNGENKILSGTQRWTVLNEMRKEGWVIPKIPVNFIVASNLAEAKKRLLGYVSQYGKVTQEGLFDFLQDNILTAEDLAVLKIPEFDMLDFIEKHMPNFGDGLGVLPNEVGPSADGAFQKVEAHVRMQQLFFNEAQANEFLEKIHRLQAFLNKENVTDTVLEIVRESYTAHFPGA